MQARVPVLSAAAFTALLGAAAIFAGALPNTADADAGSLAPVAWMAGDWETRDAMAHVEEHWTHSAGGGMLGNSRAIKDGKMAEFQFLRIEARADGIFYMPQPSGKPPVDFKFTPTRGEKRCSSIRATPITWKKSFTGRTQTAR